MIGLAISLVLALAPAPQQAEPVEVGNWLVGPAGTDSCQMVGTFGDHLLVSISENAMGVGHFVFSDDRWTLEPGAARPGTISWDGWKTSAEVRFTAGKTAKGQSILTMETDSGFTENLVGEKHFWLRVPGVGFDDVFEIPDAGAAVSALAGCNAKL